MKKLWKTVSSSAVLLIICLGFLINLLAFVLPLTVAGPFIEKFCGGILDGGITSFFWCFVPNAFLVLLYSAIILSAGMVFLFRQLQRLKIQNLELLFVTALLSPITVFLFFSPLGRMMMALPVFSFFILPIILLFHYALFSKIQIKIPGIRPSIISLLLWALLITVLWTWQTFFVQHQEVNKLTNVSAFPSPSSLSSTTLSTSQAQTTNISTWKTYSSAQYDFSFQYPPNLYFEDDSQIRGLDGQGVIFGFYKKGVKADPSYGEHVGNEVLILSITNADEDIQRENLLTASKENVQGKPLLRNADGKNNIEVLLGKKIIFVEQEQ